MSNTVLLKLKVRSDALATRNLNYTLISASILSCQGLETKPLQNYNFS
ncbi:MAG: hypothetical protein AAGJ08_00490 [Cyanobacteria bacterium P01_H01_bin.35]